MTVYVGIDVSKDHLDVCADTARLSVVRHPNILSSTESLAAALKDATLVVVEATGGYEQAVVHALQQHQVPVSVVNPQAGARLRPLTGPTG